MRDSRAFTTPAEPLLFIFLSYKLRAASLKVWLLQAEVLAEAMPRTAHMQAGPSNRVTEELFPESDVRREWSGICRVVGALRNVLSCQRVSCHAFDSAFSLLTPPTYDEVFPSNKRSCVHIFCSCLGYQKLDFLSYLISSWASQEAEIVPLKCRGLVFKISATPAS